MVVEFKMQKPAVTIRGASLEDNQLLAALGAKTFHDAFIQDNRPENIAAYIRAAFSPQKQAAELADPASVFFIAEVDGAPVGYAYLHAGRAADGVTGEHPLELVRIYALQEWTGHGIGTALMQTCLDEACQRGHDALWLGVWERNPRAIAFYRRWGFETVGSHVFLLGNEAQTDLLMQRGL